MRTFILFASTIWSSVDALPQQQTSFGVKITAIASVAKGQQVAIGKNLTLLGTSSYNASSNCGVFVIVAAIEPNIMASTPRRTAPYRDLFATNIPLIIFSIPTTIKIIPAT